MTASFDAELLQLAQMVLGSAGFSTERIEIAPTGSEAAGKALEVLLAQNAFFIIAVTSGATVADLASIEEQIALELTQRSEVSQLGAKQWDLYLVLLASQTPPEGEASTELVSLRHNTRLVRRLVHAGVRPTLEDLQRALRPFLPLPDVSESAVLEDALVLLERQLASHGVSEELAGRAVAAFRETGALSSV